MTRTLYIDAFSGASGDMLLGAFLDLGLEPDQLEAALCGLGLPEWSLTTARVDRGGLTGVSVTFEAFEQPHHRNYVDICSLIENAKLSTGVRSDALRVFDALASVEAHIHGISKPNVHFHEVGAIDSILDIVGSAWCLHALNIDRLVFSELPWSSGMVACQHGLVPLPAPATSMLLKNTYLVPAPKDIEWITPTGAAILTTLGTQSRGFVEGTLKAIGWGAGQRNPSDRPNLLRACIVEHETTPSTTVLIETNIDDASAEEIGFLIQQLLQADTLDVWSTPILMKKNRLGHQVSILCTLEARETVSRLIFRHSSTFGIRYRCLDRMVLRRIVKSVHTIYGWVDVKYGYLDGELMRRSPEYETCAKLAQTHGVAIRKVFEAALEACCD